MAYRSGPSAATTWKAGRQIIMPDAQLNAVLWKSYDWSLGGEEWSTPWGSSFAQWCWCILPRIRSFVPTGTILEIATGFGRWTGFLGTLCDHYYGIDISAPCIEHCRRRFQRPHMQFFVNDGSDLSMIADGSVDFAFSFDSLVHVDALVMKAYTNQVIAKLTAKGAAFIHHSNLAARALPAGRETYLRDAGVSAALVRDFVDLAGGQILRQEIVHWGGIDGLDCLTLFSKAGAYKTAPEIATNNAFMDEADNIRKNIAPWQFR
jgi:hypothetical protein